MIAMQYSFTLPADYDMEIIDRRVRERGHTTDGFPHLRFKTYLVARRGEFGSRENLYAPFYLWDRPEGASNFLTGPGFEAVAQSFGRPSVRHWIVWGATVSDAVAEARFAVREIDSIGSDALLSDIRSNEIARADAHSGDPGTLASVCAFEPRTWTLVRFTLHRDPPDTARKGQIYRVGHLSLPSTAAEA